MSSDKRPSKMMEGFAHAVKAVISREHLKKTFVRPGDEAEEVEPMLLELRHNNRVLKDYNQKLLGQLANVRDAVSVAERDANQLVTKKSVYLGLDDSDQASSFFGPFLHSTDAKQRVVECEENLFRSSQQYCDEANVVGQAALFDKPIVPIEMIARWLRPAVVDMYSFLVEASLCCDPQKAAIVHPVYASVKRIFRTLLLFSDIQLEHACMIRESIEDMEEKVVMLEEAKNAACRDGRELAREVESLRDIVFQASSLKERSTTTAQSLEGELIQVVNGFVLMQVECTVKKKFSYPHLMSEVLLLFHQVVDAVSASFGGKRINYDPARETTEPFDMETNRKHPTESFAFQFTSVENATAFAVSIHTYLLDKIRWTEKLLAIHEFSPFISRDGKTRLYCGLRTRVAVHCGCPTVEYPLSGEHQALPYVTGILMEKLSGILMKTRAGETCVSAKAYKFMSDMMDSEQLPAAVADVLRNVATQSREGRDPRAPGAGGFRKDELIYTLVPKNLEERFNTRETREVFQSEFPPMNFWRPMESAEDLRTMQYDEDGELGVKHLTPAEYEAIIEGKDDVIQKVESRVAALQEFIHNMQVREDNLNRQVEEKKRVVTELERRLFRMFCRAWVLRKTSKSLECSVMSSQDLLAQSSTAMKELAKNQNTQKKTRCFEKSTMTDAVDDNDEAPVVTHTHNTPTLPQPRQRRRPSGDICPRCLHIADVLGTVNDALRDFGKLIGSYTTGSSGGNPVDSEFQMLVTLMANRYNCLSGPATERTMKKWGKDTTDCDAAEEPEDILLSCFSHLHSCLNAVKHVSTAKAELQSELEKSQSAQAAAQSSAKRNRNQSLESALRKEIAYLTEQNTKTEADLAALQDRNKREVEMHKESFAQMTVDLGTKLSEATSKYETVVDRVKQLEDDNEKLQSRVGTLVEQDYAFTEDIVGNMQDAIRLREALARCARQQQQPADGSKQSDHTKGVWVEQGEDGRFNLDDAILNKLSNEQLQVVAGVAALEAKKQFRAELAAMTKELALAKEKASESYIVQREERARDRAVVGLEKKLREEAAAHAQKEHADSMFNALEEKAALETKLRITEGTRDALQIQLSRMENEARTTRSRGRKNVNRATQCDTVVVMDVATNTSGAYMRTGLGGATLAATTSTASPSSPKHDMGAAPAPGLHRTVSQIKRDVMARRAGRTMGSAYNPPHQPSMDLATFGGSTSQQQQIGGDSAAASGASPSTQSLVSTAIRTAGQKIVQKRPMTGHPGLRGMTATSIIAQKQEAKESGAQSPTHDTVNTFHATPSLLAADFRGTMASPLQDRSPGGVAGVDVSGAPLVKPGKTSGEGSETNPGGEQQQTQPPIKHTSKTTAGRHATNDGIDQPSVATSQEERKRTYHEHQQHHMRLMKMMKAGTAPDPRSRARAEAKTPTSAEPASTAIGDKNGIDPKPGEVTAFRKSDADNDAALRTMAGQDDSKLRGTKPVQVAAGHLPSEGAPRQVNGKTPPAVALGGDAHNRELPPTLLPPMFFEEFSGVIDPADEKKREALKQAVRAKAASKTGEKPPPLSLQGLSPRYKRNMTKAGDNHGNRLMTSIQKKMDKLGVATDHAPLQKKPPQPAVQSSSKGELHALEGTLYSEMDDGFRIRLTRPGDGDRASRRTQGFLSELAARGGSVSRQGARVKHETTSLRSQELSMDDLVSKLNFGDAPPGRPVSAVVKSPRLGPPGRPATATVSLVSSAHSKRLRPTSKYVKVSVKADLQL